ncbi:MAG: helix-turn-helix domain-containing protein [Candidatus Sumerlaeia bacterium]
MGKQNHDAGREFITVDELAKQLKVHPRTIQRIVERKELRAIRIGRQWRFRKEWVEEWLESNTVNGDESE